MKHIAVDFHNLRNSVNSGKVVVKYLPTGIKLQTLSQSRSPSMPSFSVYPISQLGGSTWAGS
ncbi:hypothetical protein KY284_033267 [Solanum tuberosum]|nr:hypothetical protein KY284_033267 [Solanum tuberosum]